MPDIQQLQLDLAELGFMLVGSADGVAGLKTEMAIREFQRYAKMIGICQEAAPGTPGTYVERLSPALNPAPYTGPIGGAPDDATVALVALWKTNRFRCPVIVQAWNVSGGAPSTLADDNIWLKDEVTSTAPRMFVRDFSAYYTLPAGHDPNGLIVTGDYTDALQGGPESVPPNHTWADAELLPPALLGKALDALSPAERSTFKVVRAESEVECVGFFDCLNAYDNAYISLGPCHWILGFGAGATVGEGELPAYFAYLAETEPAAFDAALGFFGIRADKTWGGNGGALFNSSQRKYTAWLQQQGPDGTYSAVPATADVADFFRTWHWFYRFQMAGRTVSAFRARMWDMARLRIRDIRATPWPPAAGVPDVPDGIGGTRPANLGDVFTSELATALLLRWHVRFPTDVSNQGVAGAALVSALSIAILTVPIPDPSTWNDAQEQALIAALMSVANSGGNQDLINTLTQVQNWPAWATGPNPRGFQLDPSIGGLNDLRVSFQFADAGLPAPPA